MNRMFWICVATAGVALGCNKGAGGSSDGCKPGAYVHKAPDYCIDLPPGFVAKPEEKVGTTGKTIRFENPAGRAMEVRYDPKLVTATYIAYLKGMGSEHSAYGDGVAQGALPGGGYFAHTHYKSGVEQVEYMMHGPKGDLVCYLNQTSQDAPPLEAACKSLKWQ